MKLISGLIALLVLVSFLPYLAYGEPEKGKLTISVMAWGGERPGPHGMLFKIYQGNNNTATEITPTSNPYDVLLPLGHRYKVEVFAGGMHADFAFVDLREKNQKVELSVPSAGSLLLTAYYKDGYTPLEGAEVSLRSGDGKFQYWTNSTTDSFGNTVRYWLQPTLRDGEYYVADFYLGKEIKYSYSPITIQPAFPLDIKVVTPWPAVIDQLITVSIYESDTKVSGLDRKLFVELYDSEGELVQSSKVNHKGDAHFYNLKVGTYTFKALSQNENGTKEWGEKEVTLSGRTDPIRILANPYETENGTDKYIQNPPPAESDTGPAETIVGPPPEIVESLIANDDADTTPVNTPVTIDVLANDSAPDGDIMSLDSFDATSQFNGTVARDDNGTPQDTSDDKLVYTPPENASGIDTFTHTISDGNGGTDTATVTVTVAAVDEPPAAEPPAQSSIPSWIRSVADWWSKGDISDQEFLNAIEYLINNKIISIQHLPSS